MFYNNNNNNNNTLRLASIFTPKHQIIIIIIIFTCKCSDQKIKPQFLITCEHHAGAVKRTRPNAIDHSSPADSHTTCRLQCDEQVIGYCSPDLRVLPSSANCNTSVNDTQQTERHYLMTVYCAWLKTSPLVRNCPVSGKLLGLSFPITHILLIPSVHTVLTQLFANAPKMYKK